MEGFGSLRDDWIDVTVLGSPWEQQANMVTGEWRHRRMLEGCLVYPENYYWSPGLAPEED